MKKVLTTTGGFLLMLMLGSIYSYPSTLEQPLSTLNNANAWIGILPFVTVTAFLGLGAVIGGFAIQYVGARTLAIAGAVLWGAANIISGLGLHMGIAWVTLWYGIFGGFGVGIAYISVLSQTIAWYPKARGLFSGLSVMGFGLGSTLYTQLLRLMPAYGELNDLLNKRPWDPSRSPAAVADHLTAIFMMSGIVFAIIGTFGAALLIKAPSSLTRDDTPRLSPKAILEHSEIWVLWMMLFMNVFAGLFVITNVITILNNDTHEPIATIAAVYSLIAIANGLGRVFFGGLSDVFGRRTVFYVIYGVQFMGYALLDTPLAANLWLSTALVTLILLCYGGGFGTMPAYVSDTVGARNFAPSYGIVLTAWGLAGVIAPIIATYEHQLNINVNSMLTPLDLIMGISIVLPIIVSIGTVSDLKSLERAVAKAARKDVDELCPETTNDQIPRRSPRFIATDSRA